MSYCRKAVIQTELFGQILKIYHVDQTSASIELNILGMMMMYLMIKKKRFERLSIQNNRH